MVFPNDIQKNITLVNKTIKPNRKIEFIVIHYCGGIGWAKGVSNYFKSQNRHASAHYIVDEDEIWQCVEDKDVAWHCGDSGIGAYKSECSNSNSIGIEMCVQNPNGNVNSVQADAGWFFDPQTLKNTQELVKYLMKEYDIPIDHVIRHYDVTAKWCPAPFVNGQLSWEKDFLSGLEEKKLDEPSAWAVVDWNWCKEQGIITGGDPKSPVTREQVAIILHRFYVKFLEVK